MPTQHEKEAKLQQYKDHLIRSRLEVLPEKQEKATILHHRCLGVQGDVELHVVTYKKDNITFNDTVVGYHKRDFTPGDEVLFRFRGDKQFPVEMVQSIDL